MDDKIDAFLARLLSAPGFHATVDRADDPLGVCFIDVSGPGFSTQVSFQPAVGFGFFLTSDAFGQKPDLLIQEPAVAAERLLQTVPYVLESDSAAG